MVSKKDKRDNEKNANYSYNRQVEPEHRMGTGSYANLPAEPIMKPFSTSGEYRDGLINRIPAGLYDISGIEENARNKP